MCKFISIGAAQVDEEEMLIIAKVKGIWVGEEILPGSEVGPSIVFIE